jgi:hypothetical protein
MHAVIDRSCSRCSATLCCLAMQESRLCPVSKSDVRREALAVKNISAHGHTVFLSWHAGTFFQGELDHAIYFQIALCIHCTHSRTCRHARYHRRTIRGGPNLVRSCRAQCGRAHTSRAGGCVWPSARCIATSDHSWCCSSVDTAAQRRAHVTLEWRRREWNRLRDCVRAVCIASHVQRACERICLNACGCVVVCVCESNRTCERTSVRAEHACVHFCMCAFLHRRKLFLCVCRRPRRP